MASLLRLFIFIDFFLLLLRFAFFVVSNLVSEYTGLYIPFGAVIPVGVFTGARTSIYLYRDRMSVEVGACVPTASHSSNSR